MGIGLIGCQGLLRVAAGSGWGVAGKGVRVLETDGFAPDGSEGTEGASIGAAGSGAISPPGG